MTSLNSFEELNGLLHQLPRGLSNNYFFAADLKRLIASGSLFYVSREDALYLFERREGYYKLYFTLGKTGAKLPEQNEALAAYVVYRDGHRNSEIEEWLLNQGFRLEKEQLHLVTDKLDELNPSFEESPATWYEARELFYDCFGAICSDLPPSESCGAFLSIRSDDGGVMGVIHCGEPLIIAVKETARRQKIASKLFAAFAAYHSSGVCKLWTDKDNPGAHALYKSLGFIPDGRRAALYIREKGTNLI